MSTSEDSASRTWSGAGAGTGALAYTVAPPGAQGAAAASLDAPHYVVSGEQGRGAIGRVLRAHDTRLGRLVAIKELLSLTDDARARFLREARVTARLQHPSIVPVYELGYNADGSPYYAMKLVSGQPFDEVIAAAPDAEARLALLPHVVAVADAMAYAHELRIVHRDLKPSNVVVGAFGETVVVDWGLAKDLLDASGPESAGGSVVWSPEPETRTSPSEHHPVALSDTLLALSDEKPRHATVAGAVVGTPAYMPPEQWKGLPVDERADVHAIGALLYHALAGLAPYDGLPLAEALARVEEGRPVPLAERSHRAPRELVAIVERAMAAGAGDRYATAKELAADSEALPGRTAGERTPLHRRRALRAVDPQASRARDARCGEPGDHARVRRRGRAPRAGRARSRRPAVLRAARATGARRARGRAPVPRRGLLERGLPPSAREPRPALAPHRRSPFARGAPHGAGRAHQGRARRRLQPGRYAHRHGERRSHHAHLGRANRRGAPRPHRQRRAARVVRVQRGRRARRHRLGREPAEDFGSDTQTGKSQHSFDVPDVFRVAFTPDGASIVVGGHGGGVRILDAETGAVRFESALHTDRIAGIAFSPDGAEMALASWDKSVSIWDWRAGRMRTVLADHGGQLAGIAYSQDGLYLLVTEKEALVHVRDAHTLATVRTMRLPESAISPEAVFAPDGRTIITSSHDGRVRVWHASSGALLRLIDVQPSGKLFHVAVRPDGREAVSLGVAGSVHVWSLDADVDYRLLGQEPFVDATVHPSTYVELEDRHAILMPRSDGLVRLLDAATGSELRSIHVPGEAYTLASDPKLSHLAITGETSQSFPPRIWDLSSGKQIAALDGHKGPLTYGLAATPDGSTVVTGGYEGNIKLWDMQSGALRATYPVLNGRISSVAVHPDGSTIAVATEMGNVLFVDPATGTTKRTLAAHPTWIQWIAYAAGGTRLLTVGRQDHVVKMWDAASLAPLAVLTGHTGNVERATLSPDGRRIATSSVDDTARLWDARTGELLRVVRGPSSTATFRADGEELLTTGPRGYAVAWDVKLDPRSPETIAAYVAEKSPWRLVEGRLEIAPGRD